MPVQRLTHNEKRDLREAFARFHKQVNERVPIWYVRHTVLKLTYAEIAEAAPHIKKTDVAIYFDDLYGEKTW